MHYRASSEVGAAGKEGGRVIRSALRDWTRICGWWLGPARLEHRHIDGALIVVGRSSPGTPDHCPCLPPDEAHWPQAARARTHIAIIAVPYRPGSLRIRHAYLELLAAFDTRCFSLECPVCPGPLGRGRRAPERERGRSGVARCYRVHPRRVFLTASPTGSSLVPGGRRHHPKLRYCHRGVSPHMGRRVTFATGRPRRVIDN